MARLRSTDLGTARPRPGSGRPPRGERPGCCSSWMMQGVGHGSEARLGDAHRWPSQQKGPGSAADFFVLRPNLRLFGISVHLYIFICAAERAHDNASEFRFVNLNLLPKAVVQATALYIRHPERAYRVQLYIRHPQSAVHALLYSEKYGALMRAHSAPRVCMRSLPDGASRPRNLARAG